MWTLVIDERGGRVERDPLGEMTELEAWEAQVADAEEELRLTQKFAGRLRGELKEAERDVAVCEKRVARGRERLRNLRGIAEKRGGGG